MGKAKDLTEQKFGRLTAKYRGENTSDGKIRWWCECDCGNTDLVLIKSSLLLAGKTRSCGCLLKDIRKQKSGCNKYILHSEYYIGYDNNNNSFLIDVDDYEKVKDYYWYQNSSGYFVTHVDKNKVLLLHRFIMNAQKGEIVDHRYHNLNDNRKSMLRKCESSDNNANRIKTDKNKSGVVGVSWNKNTSKWRASIKKNKKSIYLGEFENIEDAIIARKEAEEKYFGEFSYENSIKLNNIIKES